jgi:hypothetical protein
MANKNETTKPSAPKPLSAEEEAELKALEAEEEEAKAAVEAALAAAKQAELSAAATQAVVSTHVKPAVVVPPPRLAGDIPVMVLKTELHCSMGGRHYPLKKGEEIQMDPGHAEELEGSGWVARVQVVKSR